MAGHMESIADKEKKAAEERKQKEEELRRQDPIYNLIQSDP